MEYLNSLYSHLIIDKPEILYMYNGDINDTKQISKGTMKKYEWKCKNYDKCNNLFIDRPRELYTESRSPRLYCKSCSKKVRVLTNKKNNLEKNGSLLDVYPNIINVWDESNSYLPNEVSRQSHDHVILRCIRNPSHQPYKIRVYNIRDIHCTNCTKCTVNTSQAEIRVYSELSNIFKEVHWQKKISNNEADIVIEDIKLVIEVDGYPWHYNKNEKDLQKNEVFKSNNYNILRIRDPKLLDISCNNIICNVSYFKVNEFNKIIDWINKAYNLKIQNIDSFNNVDFYNEIVSKLSNVPYEKSIESIFPESVNVWDYEKNKPFLPSHFSIGSHSEMWIKCKNGHSYKSIIKQLFRIVRKNKKILKCPHCPDKTFHIIRPIVINGIKYKSIENCCKQLNISKNSVYNAVKKYGEGIANIEHFQKVITDILSNDHNA